MKSNNPIWADLTSFSKDFDPMPLDPPVSHKWGMATAQRRNVAQPRIALFDCFPLSLVVCLRGTSSYTKGGTI
jgi:hypothetical protein